VQKITIPKKLWTFFRAFFALLDRGRVWIRTAAQSKVRKLPKGDIPMKHRIASLAVGFLSLVLLLQTASAAPVTGQRVNLSGASFICANQAQTGACNAEFDVALGYLSNAQGTWVATVSLPGGTVVAALTLCGQFNEVDSSITATLDSIPLTAATGFPSAVPMASIQSSGASNKTQCFTTKTIANPTINNKNNQYYVVVVVPDNDGVNFTSVQIEY
jgi:hypothetical protein